MLPGLKEGVVSSGEVLNHQRNNDFLPVPFHVQESHPDFERFYEASRQELLKYREGYIIKDVVQPYLVLRFIQQYPDCFNVLFVHRPLEHVKFSLRRKNWSFVRDVDELFKQFNCFPALDVSRAYYDVTAFEESLGQFYDSVLPHDYQSPEFTLVRDRFFEDFHSDGGRFGYLSPAEDYFSLTGCHEYDKQAGVCWSAQSLFSVTVDLKKLPFPPGKLIIGFMLPELFEGMEFRLGYRCGEGVQRFYTVSQSDRLHFLDIELSTKGQDKLVLEFSNSRLLSPVSLGKSTDTRNLGVGIASIGLFATEAKSSGDSPQAWRRILKCVAFTARKLWYSGKLLIREGRIHIH